MNKRIKQIQIHPHHAEFLYAVTEDGKLYKLSEWKTWSEIEGPKEEEDIRF